MAVSKVLLHKRQASLLINGGISSLQSSQIIEPSVCFSLQAVQMVGNICLSTFMLTFFQKIPGDQADYCQPDKGTITSEFIIISNEPVVGGFFIGSGHF